MVFKYLIIAWFFKFCLAKQLHEQISKDIVDKLAQNERLELADKYSDSEMEMDYQDYLNLDNDLTAQEPIAKRSYFMCLFRHCPIEMRLRLMKMYKSDQNSDSISHYKHIQTKRNYLLGKRREKNFRDFISMRY